MFELDRDIALSPIGDHAFEANVSDAWGIYGNPNGGYLAALTGRALSLALPHPDPITLTTHYLRARSRSGARRHRRGTRRAQALHGRRPLVPGGPRAPAYDRDVRRSRRDVGQTREDEEIPVPPLEACEARVGTAERIDVR